MPTMPLRSKQPSRKTKSSSNKTKARLHQKSSSPIEQTPDPSAGEQQEEEEEDQSSDEEAPRLYILPILTLLFALVMHT
jgi:cobalamin biosynthesis Mg chelatase CobN